MKHLAVVLPFVLTITLGHDLSAQVGHTSANPLEMPSPGANTLRILSPTLLELVRITSKAPDPARVDAWDFFNTSNVYQAPALTEFTVKVNGTTVALQGVGFKRRPLYVPVAVRDLRVHNAIYLTLAAPVSDGQTVVVTNPSGNLWSAGMIFSATMDPLRYSPVIHVNQEGYVPGFPKEAMIGYYLGNLGEMNISTSLGFKLVNASSGAEVYTGTLTSRLDTGFLYTSTPYQKVLEADFSSFTTPGKYKLKVPGLGASVSFSIDEGVAMCHARTYAQGLYHQRCGMAKALPYSRFTHGACHTAAAEIPVPESSYSFTWTTIASVNADYASNPRHTAPQLNSVAAQLYPILRTGTVNVLGGHHDAGDYSKYTINSSAMIHYLVFAADAFPNAGNLDNLGLPESSDGKSDLLQEAKWEADYLIKLQDTDGGFFFLVYPKTRKYEDDVLPDHGDTQVVWPKNTSATAAAVAALAEIASSPKFKTQYPTEAADYLTKATAGWNFLINAINSNGKDGSYQKVTHYGDVFMHDDELVWAAAAMYAATGNSTYQTKLMEWMPDPNATSTRRWGWWRCFEGYGCAIRTYAFAARTGRLSSGQLNASYLLKCENELKYAADDQTTRATACAYGSSLPNQDKSYKQASWFFSNDKGFDIAVGYQINAAAGYLPAIVSNLNYESGCNPLNMTFITGLGWRRQSEIVSQYALNDRRIMPPSGICLGNMQGGFDFLSLYGNELGTLNYPSDGATTDPYPVYDRWGDAHNVKTEFVVADLAMSLADLSFLAGQTTTRTQTWNSATGTMTLPALPAACGSSVTATLSVPGMDLSLAKVVWEAKDQEPAMGGSTFTFSPLYHGTQWVEAEATWADGKRVNVAGNFSATNNSPGPGLEYTADSNTIALYHFTNNYNDSGSGGYHLVPSGNVTRGNDNLAWMINPAGEVARFTELGDKLSVTIPDSAIMPGATASALTMEAWIYPRAYQAYGIADSPVLELTQATDSRFSVMDGKWNNPKNPHVLAAGTTLFTAAQWNSSVQIHRWQHLQVTFDTSANVRIYLDGTQIASAVVPQNYGRTTNWTLTLGNFDGDIDELRISKVVTAQLLPTVSISLTDSSAAESSGTANPGLFTLTRFGSTANSLVVNYTITGSAVNGTDYTSITGSRTFAAGSSSQTISVSPINDALVEGNETTTITLSSNANYNVGNPSSRTLTIADNDSAPNTAPVVNAGTDQVITSPASANLSGSVTDDGQPLPVTLTKTWSKISGPGTVTFGNSSNPVTTASFSSTGVYVLRLTGNDGNLSASDDVQVTVNAAASDEFTVDANTVALYHFNGNYNDAGANAYHLTAAGGTTRTSSNTGWMQNPSGEVVRFAALGDTLSVTIPDSALQPGSSATAITVEAWIYPRDYKAYAIGNYPVLELFQNADTRLSVLDGKWNNPQVPSVYAAGTTLITNSLWSSEVEMNIWHRLKITFATNGTVSCYLDNVLLNQATVTFNTARTTDWTLTLGNFDGDIDEVRVSKVVR